MTPDFPKTEILDTPAGREVLERLAAANTVVLTTHEGPDGDGLGSEVALCRALRKLGKRVTIVNPGPTLRRFQGLDSGSDIHVYKPEWNRTLMEADLALLVDTAEYRRSGPVGEVFAKRTGPTLAIDHHSPNDQTLPGLLGSRFSSTGELMTHVILHLGLPLTKDLADPLFGAILFDTAQFRFVRNDAEVFRTTALLVDAGADAEGAAKTLFGTVRREAMMLNCRLMDAARFECDGRLAWATITPAMTAGLKVDRDEVRALVNVLGDLEGVEIACLFKVFEDERTKVSLRSRGTVTIGDVAESLGGGGHPFAAGADVDGSLEDVIQRTIGALKAKLA